MSLQKFLDALNNKNIYSSFHITKSWSISADEINALNNPADCVLHKILNKSDASFIVNSSDTLGIIKFLIESGVKYDTISPIDNTSPLLLALKNNFRADIVIYLLRQHLQDAGSDFEKLKLLNANIFPAIARKGYMNGLFSGSGLFAEVVETFPELLKPLAIDPIFFLDAEEKSSRNISDAASFDPVQALEGKGLQVSITPSLASKKKTILIDHSFLNGKDRQFKQIRRLIAEGFRVLTFDENGNFIELQPNFEKDVFEKAKNFSFAKNSKKYYEMLGQNFALPNDEVLLLDASRSKELETLFYSPLYIEGIVFDKNDPFSGALFGRYDDIEKLPKDDLSYLMRVGIAKDLTDEEIIRLLAKEPKLQEIDVAKIAVASSQNNVLDLLLRNGFSFADLKLHLKSNFLFKAAALGNFQLVKLLLENTANPKTRDAALPFAAERGHTEIVIALIEKGVDVNYVKPDGLTALMYAAENGHTETVIALIEKGANVNYARSERTALTMAAESGRTETVIALIEKGADVNYVGRFGLTALMRATKNGHTETVIALIEKGADVNYVGLNEDRAITLAAGEGNTETVIALIEKGANVNYDAQFGNIPLMRATRNGHTETVIALIEKGANVNYGGEPNGDTPLMYAAQSDHTKIVIALIEKGADVNYVGPNGDTALIIAARNGHTETVIALIERGADVNYGGIFKCTALIDAAKDGHTETVIALIERGADVNYVGEYECTALMYAAKEGHTETVIALIKRGADVNYEGKSECTALMYAAKEGHTKIEEVLIKAAARSKRREIRVNTGPLSGNFLRDSSSEPNFTMVLAGEIMNLEKLTKVLPYPARARVEVQSISRDTLVKQESSKAHNRPLLSEEISILQKNFTECQTEFENSTDKAYFSFINQVQGNKTTQLLSINYPAQIVGIKTDNGAKIIELLQDEFGFYHVKTNKPCKVEYVLEVDHTCLPKLDQETPLGQIIAEYNTRKAVANQEVPARGASQSSENYLEQIFQTRAPASCGLRTAAFMHKIKKDHPNLLEQCRIINIDRNHAAIEVKTGEGPNDFVYVDLGGTRATLKEVAGNYVTQDTSPSRRSYLRTASRIVALPFAALSRRVAGFFRRASDEHGLDDIASITDPALSPEPRAVTVLENQVPPTKPKPTIALEANAATTTTDAPTSNPALTQTPKPFKHFTQTQNSQQPPKIKPENISEIFSQEQKSQKLPSLLFTNKGESSSCANLLIESARKAKPERPIFYIDSPKQIDILKKAIKIIGEGEGSDKLPAEISEKGFLADFLQEAGLYNNQQRDSNSVTLAIPKQSSTQNHPPLLIINWSNFTPRQRTSLNTILDDRHPAIDGASLAEVKVISICDQKINDESFVSRHANQYQAEFNLGVKASTASTSQVNASQAQAATSQNAASTATTPQTTTNIDLKGVSDWKQQLFGRISLQNNQILWTKSSFVRDLERGVTNFSISNCSNITEFKKFLEQAQAFGCFVYNGYKIPLNDDFKIAPTAKNFDFNKFDPTKIALIRNKTIDEVALECEIINTQIFDFLLRKKEISASGEYSEKPGFIELAKENPNKVLKLFISSNLTQAQLYSLFYEASAANISLELSFAQGVATPDYLSRFVVSAKDQLLPENRKSIAAKIYTAANPRLIEVEDSALVVDIEDCSFQDLISRISYKISSGSDSGNTFTFSESKSEFVKHLKQGQQICLRGEFSEDLLQMLQPILTEDYAKNLTLIIENKDNKAHKLLEFLGKKGYTTIPERAENPARESKISPENHQPSCADFATATDAELMTDATNFKDSRKSKFKQLLENNALIALYGDAGVGKTSLVHEEKNLHKGFENFDNWIAQGGILFLDESNIIDSHLIMFEPLKEGGNKRIFYQGKFYQLNKEHQVVLALNPPEYGGGRAEQKLSLEGGLPTFAMQQLPASYIYSLLKTEIFDKTAFVDNAPVRDEFLKFCKEEIVKYQDLIKTDSKEKITIRALQESALGWLTLKLDGKEVRKEASEAKLEAAAIAARSASASKQNSNKKYPYAKDIKTQNFVSTDATIAIENSLGKCLAIRQKQCQGQLPICGTNGVLFEGASGIGKSALIKAYLDQAREEEGREYYKIDSSMPYEIQKQKLVEAFRKGAILWIDEIDTCINNGIERLLTSALSGLDPEGLNHDSSAGSGEAVEFNLQQTTSSASSQQVAPNAGFMLVASSNGITQAGRAVIGPAIRSRLDYSRPSDLQEYEQSDIEKIITTWVVGDRDKDKKGATLSAQAAREVSVIAREYLELQQSGGENAMNAGNLRMLRRFVDEQKERFEVVERAGESVGGVKGSNNARARALTSLSKARSTDI